MLAFGPAWPFPTSNGSGGGGGGRRRRGTNTCSAPCRSCCFHMGAGLGTVGGGRGVKKQRLLRCHLHAAPSLRCPLAGNSISFQKENIVGISKNAGAHFLQTPYKRKAFLVRKALPLDMKNRAAMKSAVVCVILPGSWALTSSSAELDPSKQEFHPNLETKTENAGRLEKLIGVERLNLHNEPQGFTTSGFTTSEAFLRGSCTVHRFL